MRARHDFDRKIEMRIREHDIYYGCVFSQILDYSALTTFKKVAGQQGVYTINDESLLVIKYSREADLEWHFSLSKSELARFKEDDLLMPVFMAFVCSNQQICLLKLPDVIELLGKGRGAQTFIISPRSKSHFQVRNHDQDLSKQISIRAFPSLLFDAFGDKDDSYAWPPLCAINVYREKPAKIFSSNDRRLDLSDLLIQDLTDNEVRVNYVGVSTRNPAWEIWDEPTKRKIVEHMVYLFEFEGVAVDIEPVTNESDVWCTDEFIWKIEYWREPSFSEESLIEGRKIVLDFQLASAALLERHLGISYHQAFCIMNELENEGVVSPIKSDGSRDMLVTTDYSAASGFLFLDDERTPPADVLLCRDADHAIALIETGNIKVISFDHDLGTKKTGYDVAKHIEKLVKVGRIAMPDWHIHSASPGDRRMIKTTMESAQRFSQQKNGEM